jgi:tetratricopeptide (TPR) repeat protein
MYMKHIIIFISALLLSFSILAQDEQAQKYVEREQYSKANVIYKNLLVSNAKKASEYYYYLGDICLKKDKNDSAKYFFMEGIKVDETYALNYVGIGIVSIRNNNATEGQRSFDKALQLTSSKNGQVLNAIGEYYVLEATTAELPKGIILLKKSTEVDAKNATSWMLLGDAYGRQGEGTKQIDSYNKASTLVHSVPLLKMKYGKMYTSARNIDLAVQCFNEGLAVDATYGPIYRELGDVYNRFKKYDLAIDNYKKYVSYIDRNDDVEFRYGFFLLKNQDYADAVEVLNTLEQRKYDSPYIYNRRAVCYYELKKYGLAKNDIETYFKKVNVVNTKSADYEYYGKILLKTGQDSLAVIQLQSAVDKDTTRLDLYGEIGTYYYSKGNYEKATQYMSKQVKPATKDPKIFFELGQAYFYNKDYVKADSSFAKLVALKPAVYIGYLWRGRAISAQDPEIKQGLAKPFYEKVIELCGSNGVKYKAELIEANEYLAVYYTVNQDKVKSDAAWKNILAIDPTNTRALNALKTK